ncbi:MAG: M28 family peptidase [Betaproteobacteria bacterium]|nr:M28 family peptidase [Betaproteobacteria bacterium]
MRFPVATSALIALATAFATGLAFITQPFVQPIPSRPPAVDPNRLQAHVKYLSVDLYPRSHEQSRNLERAAQYIQGEFKTAGGVVTVQDVVVEETTHKNVIARFGPVTGPVLVIGAHYDSHGDANAGAKHPRGHSPETHTPGADDNASGVAGLIELAHLLGRAPQARPIELVAYTTEEPPHFRTPHMGSAWHARSLRATNRELALMLSLEMIGYFSDAPGSQRYPLAGMSHLYSDRGNFIALVGKLSDFGAMRRTKAAMAGATDLPVLSINAPPFVPGIDFSDHLNYWHEGFPAFMVTDTAFMRNPHYHKSSDTYEKLDYARMAKVVQGVYAVTQRK